MQNKLDAQMERSAMVIAYQKFQLLKNKAEYVFFFVEGEDDLLYYPSKARGKYSGKQIAALHCGGKKGVLEIHKMTVSDLISQRIVGYFVDRDFEDWFVNPDREKIYVTPCYSIENFYISEECFKKVISSEFKLTEFNECRDEFNKSLSFYRSTKTEFSKHISQFNYWIKAHRIMERDNKAPASLNVRNVKIGDLVSLDFSGLSIQYDCEKPSSVFKDSLKIDLCSDSMTEAQDSLPLSQWEQLYRGKQLAEFMRIFLTLLKSDRTSKTPVFFKEKGPLKITLSKENLVSELSQYADTPICLTNFLSSYRESLAA